MVNGLDRKFFSLPKPVSGSVLTAFESTTLADRVLSEPVIGGSEKNFRMAAPLTREFPNKFNECQFHVKRTCLQGFVFHGFFREGKNSAITGLQLCDGATKRQNQPISIIRQSNLCRFSGETDECQPTA